MPIDPFDDVADDERTAELPMLVETVVLGAEHGVSPEGDLVEDTAERTAKFVGLTSGSTADIEALQSDLAARGAKIAALEDDIARLSARWNEVERHLTARDTRIEELNRTLGELRHSLANKHAEDQRLRAELEQRTASVQRLEAENRELRAAAESARAGLDAVARQRAEPVAPVQSPVSPDIAEEIATLRAYIANRNDWWRQLKTTAAEAQQRVNALQHEVRQLTLANEEANALAARESARASGLRSELVIATRRLEEQGREQAVNRPPLREGAEPPPTPSAAAAAATQTAPNLASIDQQLASAASAPGAAAAEVPPAPAFDVLAALEAEVAHKRQQIAAQLVELRDREREIEASAAMNARLQKEVAGIRTELDQRRADVGRLERAVVDKDRALEARDVRIATLQEELNQRLGAIQKLNAMDLSLQGLSSKMSDRLRRAEGAAEPAGAPTLVCLTGDAPKQLVLTKKSVTIGRGHHCDVQILTHFVSREHARLTSDGSIVIVEDLASTNGVFVNSVRVERHELRHGDLVTIGETQFRFLESVAH
jgi:chromosome segregation ATPase